MESLRNLIELLKSQLALYTEIRDELTAEKQAIIDWKFIDTARLTKNKEALIHKERILEEARKTLTERIIKEYGINDTTLGAIIDACPDEKGKSELLAMRDSLGNIAASISGESTALKILYATNIRLVNELYAKMGYSPTNKYGMDKRTSPMSASISAIG